MRNIRKHRILFLLKDRLYSPSKVSYGLINSSGHLAKFLEHHNYDCKIVTVTDGNDIDREMHVFKPDVVVIEALWVPTYKMKELIELPKYKHVQWVVRVHSDIGYLSVESNSLKLINEYRHLKKRNLTVSMNHSELVEYLSEALKDKFTYLPNVIIQGEEYRDTLEEKKHIDVGCFGATRILKNQVFQAMVAIKAADVLHKQLRFHVTPNLGEEHDPVLNNLKELFKDSHHDLVIHDWLPNHEFQALVRRMDLGIQLSYTESFNIVTADFINNNRIIVVSDAIDWLSPIFKTSTTNYEEAAYKLVHLYKHRNNEVFKHIGRENLHEYNEGAKREWLEFLRKALNK